MTKIAIIGCGNIAKFHIPALKKVGITIVAISGRKNSYNKLLEFSKLNNLDNCKIFSSSIELIHSDIWDALLICCPTKNSLEYLKIACDYKKPILVEKPINYQSYNLLPLLKYENIKVAFNRRFYSSVKFAKKFYDTNNISFIRISIPEKNNQTIKSGMFPISIYENSIHIFDLLNYISDKFVFDFSKSLIRQNKYRSIIASGSSKKGSLLHLNICFNSSDNFSINIVSDTKKVDLCPIEIARLYDGLEKINPTKKNSIRRYNPIVQNEIIASDIDNLKPGFYEQALNFNKFCKGKFNEAPTIKDAYNSLKSIEQLYEVQKN